MAEEKKSILDDIFKWGCPALIIGATFLIFAFVTGYSNMFSNNDNPGGPYGPGSTGTSRETIKDDCQDIPKQARDYIQFINKEAAAFNLDPALIAAVIEKESNWDPKAYRYESHLGDASYGLMQTLSGTARGMGFKGTNEGLYDPAVSIHYGSKYLSQQIKAFGTVDLGLAAYNAGPGNVTKDGGMPASTRTYVAKVKAFYQKYAKCLTQPTLTNTNGASSAIQKLLDAMKNWRGYVRGQIDCFRANVNLIDSVYGNGYTLSHYTNFSVDPAAKSIPSVSEMNKMNDLNARGYVVMWHIQGGYSGQHWVIPIKFESRADGYYVTYIENVGSKVETQKIDWQERKGMYFFANPTAADGSSNDVRGRIINVPDAK